MPAHSRDDSLESAISKYLCRIRPLNDKKLLCAGPGQELSVNIAVPPLPKVSEILVHNGVELFAEALDVTHATELVLERPGSFWPSNHRLNNSSSHVAD